MFGDYDEDLNDPAQRCVHGTFIGSWWGPDYLCGLCEDGITRAQQVRGWVSHSRSELNRKHAAIVDLCVAMFRVTGTFDRETGNAAAAKAGLVLSVLDDAYTVAKAAHRELVAQAWADTRPVRA